MGDPALDLTRLMFALALLGPGWGVLLWLAVQGLPWAGSWSLQRELGQAVLVALPVALLMTPAVLALAGPAIEHLPWRLANGALAVGGTVWGASALAILGWRARRAGC